MRAPSIIRLTCMCGCVLCVPLASGAQGAVTPGTTLAIPDFRLRVPAGRWTAESDVANGHVTLTESGTRSARNVIEVRIRPVPADSASGAPAEVAARLRDDARRQLARRAERIAWRVSTSVADTTIGCLALTGMRWELAPNDAREARRRESGITYFYLPPDFRVHRRALELRWQALALAVEGTRETDPFFRVIESLQRTTTAEAAVC